MGKLAAEEKQVIQTIKKENSGGKQRVVLHQITGCVRVITRDSIMINLITVTTL